MTAVVMDVQRVVTVTDNGPTTQVTVSSTGLQGPQGNPTTVNGHTGSSITLTAADVGAIATSARGAVNGVASLDGSGLVPIGQIPTTTLATSFMDLSTNQSVVSGVKAFAVSPTVPTPTTSTQVANKSYVDGLVVTAGTGLSKAGTVISLSTPVSVANGGTGSATQNFVDLSSTQAAIAGLKTFTTGIAVPATGSINANGVTDWFNVKRYGAKGDNSTDDITAITSAITAAAAVPDSVVYFPAGQYRVSTPVVVPPGVTLLGVTKRRPQDTETGYTNYTIGTSIKPLSSFTGVAVIYVPDAITQSYTYVAQDINLIGLTIDCRAMSSGTVDGVRVYGQVQGFTATDVAVYDPPGGYGFNFAKNASVSSGPVAPYSLRINHCFVAKGGGSVATSNGIFAYSPTDSTFLDTEVIGMSSDGWQIQGGAANVFIGCRSENNTGWGFNFTQTAGGSSPTASLIGCHTDLNTLGGYLVDHAGVVTLEGCISDGEGASVNGFDIRNATGLVRLTGCVANPSSGTNSQYGLNVQSANVVSVEGGAYYGATAGYHNGGSVTTLYASGNVLLLTGTVTAPTVTVLGVGTNAAGGIGMGTSIPNQYSINIASPGSTPLLITGAATGQKIAQLNGADATTIVLASLVTGDSLDRFRLLTDGTMAWGPGSGARDVTLARSGAGVLSLTAGILDTQVGTKTTTSAAVLTPSFAANTAAQLSDTTRDYMVYLQCTTAGTALVVSIGPTSTPANTIINSSTATLGELITVRLPAGWYLKWNATSAAFTQQKAIGC